MSVSVFISYAIDFGENDQRVAAFANKLKLRGLDVHISTEIKYGERFSVLMEKIQSCDFTLIICTPEYKKKADKRDGGVGYEWNIVTSSAAKPIDERKFIPVLFSGDWRTSIPIWAQGKKWMDYRDSSETEFENLIATFEEYESNKNCEILDCDGTVKPEHPADRFRERKMISIVNDKGIEEVVQVVVCFELHSTGEEYLIYTKNEIDEDDNITLYVSKMIHKENNSVSLVDVPDHEWEEVKLVMIELAKEEDQ